MQHLHACTHAHASSTQASKQLKHARQRTPATRTPRLAADPAAAASPHARHTGPATGPHATLGTTPSRPPPSPVARDHTQHNATTTPCRTRRITTDRAVHHAASHQLAAPRTRDARRTARRCLSHFVVLYAAANRAATPRHPDEAKPPLMAAELGHRRPPSPPPLPAYK